VDTAQGHFRGHGIGDGKITDMEIPFISALKLSFRFFLAALVIAVPVGLVVIGVLVLVRSMV
jgi:hypothetical protein